MLMATSKLLFIHKNGIIKMIKQPKKEELEKDGLNPIPSKVQMVINLLEEKVSREYGLTISELRSKKIEIINNKLTVK